MGIYGVQELYTQGELPMAMVRFDCYVTREQKDRLARLADTQGVSMGVLLRGAISSMFAAKATYGAEQSNQNGEKGVAAASL